jgi:hypothetical protein
MLKKIIILVCVTAVAYGIAVGDFFFMRELPRYIAPRIHDSLASLIGAGFIITAEVMRKKKGEFDYYTILLFLVGLGMIAIHVTKLVLVRCS